MNAIVSEFDFSVVNGAIGAGLDAAALLEDSGDAAANTSTIYSMSIGDTFTGTLTAGESDWIAISMVAGTTYSFSLTGTGGTPIADPYLQIYDSAGNYIGYNNDVGPGLDAAMNFTAAETGTFYISADEFNFGSGDYQLSLSAGIAYPTFTLDQIALQLTDGYWTSTSRTPLSFDAVVGDTIDVDITGLTAEGQQLARWALEAWTAASGLLFSEVTSGAGITFDDEDSGAYASSSVSNGEILSSTINISTAWLTNNGTTIDSYSFQTYMHEIGHAIGLGHGGNYNGSADYGYDSHYLNDSWQATVMSYFNQSENYNVTGDYGLTTTLMIADIIAIQNLYGSGVVNNAGNTTYGANSNVAGYLGDLFGQMTGEDAADPAIYDGNNIAITIHDSDGTDTLDFSWVSAAQRIDLAPEAISDVMGRDGNLIIARGTVIENAIGGSGADSITGNAANNGLLGGDGDDTLIGNEGNDVLFGGNDDDDLQGGANDDRLYGQAGLDSLQGEAGNDTLIGGGGNDTLRGGTGEDSLEGGGGNDGMLGGTDNDTLKGGAGNDAMYGEGGDDELRGDAGRDILRGQSGDDTLYGGDQVDVLLGGGNNDYLEGDCGNDILYGSNGTDLMYGGGDDDILRGQIGRDTLVGGTGDDTLIGGGNADIFVFANGFGTDQIHDFNEFDNNEKIDLSGVTSITNFADLTNPGGPHMTQVGADLVIDDFAGNTITVLNANIADMNAADFTF